MVGDPVHRELVDEESLLGHADRIEASPAELHRDAADLVDRSVGAQPLRMLVGDPAHPVPAAGLLVGRRREQDVAAQARNRVRGRVAPRRASLRGEEPDDPELHGDEVLHVHGSTAVHVAVRHVRPERVVRPLARRRHDVEVAAKEQRAAARSVAVQPGDHRAAGGERLDDRRRHAGVVEDRADMAGGKDLVARRVDRPQADEVAQVGDQPLVGPLPRRRLEARRGGVGPAFSDHRPGTAVICRRRPRAPGRRARRSAPSRR